MQSNAGTHSLQEQDHEQETVSTFTGESWHPEDLRIVGAPFVRLEIPVISVAEAPDMPIQKQELCTSRMKVGVDIVLLGHGRPLAIVEKPNDLRRPVNSG